MAITAQDQAALNTNLASIAYHNDAVAMPGNEHHDAIKQAVKNIVAQFRVADGDTAVLDPY